MLDALKEKLQNVHLDISSSFQSFTQKKLATSQSTQRLFSSHDSEFINDDAGGDILSKYQKEWTDIHVMNQSIASSANSCSHYLSIVCNDVETRCQSLLNFHRDLSCLPRIADQLSELVAECARLEGIAEEVEAALAYLEVVIHAEQFQEKQLEQKFQLAVYREHKMGQLSQDTAQMALDYVQKIEKKAQRQNMSRAEKQRALQEAFENDLINYKRIGKVSNSLNPSISVDAIKNDTKSVPLAVATSLDFDTSLNDDVEVDEADACALEQFLENVSPTEISDKNSQS